MKKVLFITSSYPRYHTDVAGYFVKKNVEALIKRKYAITVLCPSDKKCDIDYDRKSEEEIIRFNYFFHPRIQSLAYEDGMPQNLKKNILARVQVPFYFVANLLRGYRCAKNSDLIHAHWLVPSGLVAVLLKFITHKKVILTIHSSDLWILLKSKWRINLLRWILQNGDKVICISEFAKKKMERSIGVNSLKGEILCAPMGIDTVVTSALKQRNPLHNIKLLYMGRLVGIKGIDLLIDAVSHLKNSELTIVGDGSERIRLQNLAKTKNVDVTFYSSVIGEKKADIFNDSDVVVFPSRDNLEGFYEGVPVTLLEALAYGKTVVVSRTGGYMEIVKEGVNGLSFQANNAHDLYTVLRGIEKQPEIINRLAIPAQLTSKRFSWDNVLQKTLSLYENDA